MRPRHVPATARERIARGTDLVPRETTEGFSESVELLVEHTHHRLVGLVARRDAGASRRDDGVGAVRRGAFHRAANFFGLITDDGVAAQYESVCREESSQLPPAFVVGVGSCVADCDGCDADVVGGGHGARRVPAGLGPPLVLLPQSWQEQITICRFGGNPT